MHLDENPDYETIWKLAHNWADVDPEESDENTLSPELKQYVHRLLEAVDRQDISVRNNFRKIFVDESFISFIADFFHVIKIKSHLKSNKSNKIYLDSLYVKRSEVLNWCINDARLDPPPCWAPKQLANEKLTNTNTKNYRPVNEIEDRIRCQVIAGTLWELDPTIHPNHIARSKILQRIGNGGQYEIETVTDWIAQIDPQKDYRKPGRPPKSQCKIKFEMIPQPKK